MTEAQAYIEESIGYKGVAARAALDPGWRAPVAEVIDIHKLRQEYVTRFSFAVLWGDTLRDLAKYGPFLEIGAGTGYWAYELRKIDIDVIATDLKPPGRGGNQYWFHETRPYTKIIKVSATTAVKRYTGRTLLTVWPSYNESWAYEALLKFPGDTVVYCGEGYGGCTADDEFHTELEANWRIIEEIPLPQFMSIHDTLVVYRR